MRTIKDYLLLFAKGMGMGAADVVPGVSGGTVAFITGIYEELIESIRSINGSFLRLLLKGQIAAAWKHINGTFLTVLVMGIALSIFLVGPLVAHLLDAYPIPVWSFFFGLIIVSALSVARQARPWRWQGVLAAVVGAAVAFYITVATPANTPDSGWFIFMAGAIAICAMILPGISGAFILLLLGKYRYIFSALDSLDLTVIFLFIAGCLVGLLSFAQGVSYLLKHHHNITVGLLAGFMVGSLNKIWPWKEVVRYRENSHGEQVPFLTRNVSPTDYESLTGEPSQFLVALLFIGLGILIVVVLEKLAANLERKPQP